MNKIKAKNFVKKQSNLVLKTALNLKYNKIAMFRMINSWEIRDLVFFAEKELNRRKNNTTS